MSTGNKNKKNVTKHLIGVGITLLCIFIIAKQVNIDEVMLAIENFQWPLLFLAIGSLAFGYVLRVFRWSLMLSANGVPTTWSDCVAPFLGSIALNNVLPFRIGDAVRAFVFPASMGISKTTATSSLLMERLIDLLTLLACFSMGMLFVKEIQVPQVIAGSTAVLTVVSVTTLIFIFLFSGVISKILHRYAHLDNNEIKPGKFTRVILLASNMLLSFKVMSKPGVLFPVLTISMFIWVGESGLFYFVLIGFGFDASPALAIVVMSIATLSTLVPSSPGYVGPFHLAAFTAITMFGGSTGEAGSYAIIVHLALWLPTTIAGAIAILIKPDLFQAARTQTTEQLETR